MKTMSVKKPILDVLTNNLRILNAVTSLILFALLIIIIRMMYSFLQYMDTAYVITIITIVAGLIVVNLLISRRMSQNASSTLAGYGEQLETFLMSARDIHNINHQDILLEKIVSYSMNLTGATNGAVLLADGNSLKYKYVSSVPLDQQVELAIPKNHGIAGWVYGNGSMVNIGDVAKDLRFTPEIDGMTKVQTRSLICAPLSLKNEVIGVVELVNKDNGVFSAEDEEFLIFFADQAATAITKAQLLENQKNYDIHLTDILLDAMENNIQEKRGHSKRVAKYSLLMAKAINMKEEEQSRLYKACLLHDIGFIKIKMHEVSEKEQYKEHSRFAYEMLKPINFYSDIADIVYHHHERYDGNGYPAGLKGEFIPLESRMIAIAETFDAITSRGSYKYVGKVFNEHSGDFPGFNDAILELKNNAGTQFDPELVNLFVENITEGMMTE